MAYYKRLIETYSYSSGIVDAGKVSLLLSRLWGLGLNVAGRLIEQVSVQLVDEGLVSGFGEHRLFLEDGEDSHGTLHHVDTSLQVHTEILKDPVKTLTLVLFLLQHEHVVVEELLQLLVREVDAKLLETVELKFTK
jgi:hypothetical protein